MPSTIPAPFFSRRLGDDAVLVPRTAAIADAYYELLFANHERLARWEPWAAELPTPEGTRSFLEATGRHWLGGSELPVAIAVPAGNGWQLAGAVGLRIDRYSRSGDVGYWIDGSYEGRGLVTRAASVVLDEAFGPLALDKVTLHTEVANERSRAVALRLGFVQEGELREAHAYANERRDVAVYGLLAAEWHQRREAPRSA